MKKINKEHKEKIIEMLKKAGDPENYKISWDARGIPMSKKKSDIERGKTSRAKGASFELKVRRDLEEKERFVDKWNNNVDLEKGEVVQAKRKYNPFSRAMVIGTGFPDFISIKHVHSGLYSVIGVEVKVNGMLSKEEKEKCAFYLQKGVFSEIWIARAVQNGKKIEIKYDDFKEKHGEKYNKP